MSYQWTQNDWKVNYSGCFGLLADGRLIRVVEFTAPSVNSTDTEAICKEIGKEGYKGSHFNVDPEAIIFPEIPVGYFNTQYGCFFLGRALKKQWRRGLCADNTRMTDPAATAKYKLRKGSSNSKFQQIGSLDERQAYTLLIDNPGYVAYDEALSIITDGDKLSVAMSAELALVLEVNANVLIYRGMAPVGYVDEDGKPVFKYETDIGEGYASASA